MPFQQINTPLAPAFARERKYTLAELGRRWPCGPIDYALVYRNCTHGQVARGGERVRLEAVAVKGNLYSSDQAVRRFYERLAEADAQKLANVVGHYTRQDRRQRTAV